MARAQEGNGDAAMNALSHRLPANDVQAPSRGTDLIRGHFDPQRAISLLRSWRECSEEEAREQREAGDALLEGLERDPVRFREVSFKA